MFVLQVLFRNCFNRHPQLLRLCPGFCTWVLFCHQLLSYEVESVVWRNAFLLFFKCRINWCHRWVYQTSVSCCVSGDMVHSSSEGCIVVNWLPCLKLWVFLRPYLFFRSNSSIFGIARSSGGWGKVKWSHYTPWRRMGWEEVQLLLIPYLGIRWGWVVSITPGPRFTPGESTHGTHFTGGWVGPRAGLEAEARIKLLCLCRGSNPGRPVRSQSLYWLYL
jgi:hypothetical protein